jgi:putative protease
MELVSPAGNIEKLAYAYRFGADAVYIGIKDFSLRAKADNFSQQEYEEITKIKGSNIPFPISNSILLTDSL